jgi:hypothetical protein
MMLPFGSRSKERKGILRFTNTTPQRVSFFFAKGKQRSRFLLSVLLPAIALKSCALCAELIYLEGECGARKFS